uniref:G patch domain-containing protein 4 n=1 Tax=Oryzias latipes TaxID=8090 RepID=A0A3P9IFJ3_ORYLA
MAGVSEKSRGQAFAEQQLLRHGWEHGKGLGRAENGISEPIKVKVKCGKGGVGHREGEQFSFHWWDHVFNKASSSLQVQAHQDGIEVKKTTEEDEEGGTISNRKPRKAALAKDKLYGCFVKSATLLAGQEQPEPKEDDSSSSSSSDEEEEQKMDLSSVNKLSDADLMKACGGRTAHKGARHGLTMSAKLARLEQQEAEFMARYGQRNQPQRSPPLCVAEGSPIPEEEAAKERRPKKKKKKSAERCEEEVCPANDEERRTEQKENEAEERVHSLTAETLKETCELLTKVKKKKKKTSKHHNQPAEEDPDPEEEEAEVTETTKKSKRRKQKKEKHMDFNPADEEDAPPPLRKKKKKSKTHD